MTNDTCALQQALKQANQPLRISDIANTLRISRHKVRHAMQPLLETGAIIKCTGHYANTYTLVFSWQVKRGRYVSVLCPCGRRVILSRVRLRGFEGWYSMVCKGCKTMRYINESELED